MWLNRHRLPYITLNETENAHSRELYFILWIQLSTSYSERLSFKKDSTGTNRWINYIKNWHDKYKVKEAKLMQIENLSFNTQLNLNEFFFFFFYCHQVSKYFRHGKRGNLYGITKIWENNLSFQILKRINYYL